MTTGADDHERVRALLGREPRGRYEIVVRDDQGDPVVLRNAPLLDDGTPMPTRYWLIGPAEIKRIGRLESMGGVDAAEAAVDPDQLAAAHDRYAAERDAAIPDDHEGPRPSGGVGGTRVGVKCLHAHWGWYLAGGDDPIGRWIEQQLAGPSGPSGEVEVEVAIRADRTVVAVSDATHEIPWGHRNLTDRWFTDDDPPRPDALTNALGTIDDHLDDLLRLHPDVAAAVGWTFTGPMIDALAALEAGRRLDAGDHDYPRDDAEEVFRLVATEPARDRADNPGLPSDAVETIIATSCIVQACMRRFHLDAVRLRVTH
ncbi:MAG: DUF501 domain-containing protein [Ilumatobacteraceae bacterium]|nr:DUF501 domain-containing protein [Ilumatobacteraceae bacterium]